MDVEHWFNLYIEKEALVFLLCKVLISVMFSVYMIFIFFFLQTGKGM